MSRLFIQHGKRVLCLVLDANVHILLTLGNVLQLFLGLPRRQLIDGTLDDLQSRLDLLFRDDERRCQTDDVFMCGLGLKNMSA